MGMLDDANDFTTKLSEGMAQTQWNLFQQAWEGWEQPKNNDASKKSQDDGMGAFLAPLDSALSTLRNASDDEINASLADALKKSIYP